MSKGGVFKMETMLRILVKSLIRSLGMLVKQVVAGSRPEFNRATDSAVLKRHPPHTNKQSRSLSGCSPTN